MEDQRMVFQFPTENRDVSFSKAFRMGLRPNQHHIQWILWVSFQGVKRPEGEINIRYKICFNFKEEQMFKTKVRIKGNISITGSCSN